MTFWATNLIINVLVFGSMSAVVAAVISPLQFLKIRRQQAGFSYGHIFRTHKAKYNLKGFFVSLRPYTLTVFCSSASFGIAEFISRTLLETSGYFYSLIGILFRAILGASIELAATIYFELREIERNKGELIENTPTLKSIIIPVFLRNALFWFSPLLSQFIIRKFNLQTSFFYVFCVSLGFGIFFGAISLPFDVVASQNCGSSENLSIAERLRRILTQGLGRAYFGAVVRLTQITIYTIEVGLAMTIMNYILQKIGN